MAHYLGFELVMPSPAKYSFLLLMRDRNLPSLKGKMGGVVCFVVCTEAVKSLHTSVYAFTY